MRALLLGLLIAVLPQGLRCATISGVATENSTGRPLARCQVTLTVIQSGYDVPLRSAFTDAAGRFRFADLKDGAYSLSAERTGFAPARYGQKRWNTAGAPIVLAADAEFFAEFRMERLGAVSGRTFDENGVGLPGVLVWAYPAAPPPLRGAASAVSDDRGVYRIAGLNPGQYYLRTGPYELADRTGSLPTFFGQSPGEGQPLRVSVELDREYTGAEIHPLPGRLGRLTVKVRGGTMSGAWLFSETGVKTAAPGRDGVLVFDQLAPGEYEFLGRSADRSLVAFQQFQVTEGANEQTSTPAPMPLVRVRVVENEGKEIDPQRVSVSFRRKGLSQGLTPNAPGDVMGDSTIALTPGRYSAFAIASSAFYVQSLSVGGNAALFKDFAALPGQSLEVAVTLSSRPATLKGKVTTADGQPVPNAPVFLNPADADVRARMGGARVVRAGPDGTYQFSGLPPGECQVLSSFEYQSPQDIDWARVSAESVTLEEGREASLDLSVSGSL